MKGSDAEGILVTSLLDLVRFSLVLLLDMTWMFWGNTHFNTPLLGWDLSSATTLEGMFNAADSFNQDISGWNVSNVENMAFLFASLAFNTDVSSWDVSR